MISSADHALFRRAIDGAGDFVLVTHMHPDGDAFGSQIALARFLLALGKRVRVINNDPIPEILGFIRDPRISVETYRRSQHDDAIASASRIILVDNSVPDRLGRMEPTMVSVAARTLCIDHHPTRDAPWADNIVAVSACATTALIYELTRHYGWTVDREAAEAIYVGMATDTGFFRYNSTDVRAHQIAAELLAAGVRPARVYREIYERNSAAFTRLLGHCLAGLRLDAEGAIASVKITRQLVDTLQADDEDTSEITTSLLAMDGVRIAVLFRELPDGRIKVSLRSKGELDVHELASEFGGGGHRNASGLVLNGRLDDAVSTVTERATQMLERASA